MSVSSAESLVRRAKQQVSQFDVNQALLKAIDELMREIRHLDMEVRRIRRDFQVNRRISTT
jgi:hypothetical protein